MPLLDDNGNIIKLPDVHEGKETEVEQPEIAEKPINKEQTKPTSSKKEKEVEEEEDSDEVRVNIEEHILPKEKNKKEEPENETTGDTDELDYSGIYDWLKNEELVDELEDEYDRSRLTMKEIKDLVDKKYDKKYRKEFEESFMQVDEVTNGLLSYVLKGGTVEDFVKTAAPVYSKMTDKDIKNEQQAEDLIRTYYKQKVVS